MPHVFHGFKTAVEIRAAGAAQIAANVAEAAGAPTGATTGSIMRATLRARFPDANAAAINSVVNQVQKSFAAAQRLARAGANYTLPESAVPAVPALKDRYEYFAEATYLNPRTGEPASVRIFAGSSRALTYEQAATMAFDTAAQIIDRYKLQGAGIDAAEEAILNVWITRVERRA